MQAREIVGIAGASGNGQKELADVLRNQIRARGGRVAVQGEPYRGTCVEGRRHYVRLIPEEPLRNACPPPDAGTENLAFRAFDRRGEDSTGAWTL